MKNKTIIIITVFMLLISGKALALEKTYIVGFHKKIGSSERALIQGARGFIKRSYRLIPAMVVRLSEIEAARLRNSKDIAYVEENGIFKASDEYTNSWGVLHIGADLAHANGYKGTGVKIAVVDSGIDYSHEELTANYHGGYDFVFNDYDPDDENGHGTHVSGIIAAAENGTGIIGVSPEVELYAVRVLDGAGFGLLEWIIDGIEWAVNNGMDIINLSLEGPHFQSLQDACDNAYDAGLLLVAAGGNTSGGAVKYPAAYDSVIAVTAIDAYDDPASFAPLGPELELAAPGVAIYSSFLAGGYHYMSGTSMAAPHVTGTAALIYSTNPQDENGDGHINDEVRQLLCDTSMDLGIPGRDNTFGFGLVNAAAIGESCVCLADCNNDGTVDLSDLLLLREEFFRKDCSINPCQADCNGDGAVDLTDMVIMGKEYLRDNCCN